MHSIRKIAKYVNGDIVGDSGLIIKGLCGIDSGKDQHISYIHEKQYFKYFLTTKASAIIIQSDHDFPSSGKTVIKVNNAANAFSKLISLFHNDNMFVPFISNSAIISDKSTIGKNVYIGNHVVIDDNVCIAADVFIGNGCYIGKDSIVGKGSKISNNVTIVKNTKIDQLVEINSGTVIGGSGFGLFTENGKHSRIPHVGNVIIGEGVSIGSNCCIDRGTINDTQIGDNTFIDNLVQIAHNANLGKNCIIAGQTGIAGSAIIGNSVTTGGQVGIVGHIKIGDHVTIAGKSLVTKSIASNQVISGIPAKNHKKRIKQEATINRLPNIIKNIKK